MIASRIESRLSIKSLLDNVLYSPREGEGANLREHEALELKSEKQEKLENAITNSVTQLRPMISTSTISLSSFPIH
jgi:hypothetical protein